MNNATANALASQVNNCDNEQLFAVEAMIDGKTWERTAA